MDTDVLRDVFEATAYLEKGAPAHDVHLDVPIGGSLIGQRGLRVHGPEVVVIKPADRRH